jgi:hypothetical protein
MRSQVGSCFESRPAHPVWLDLRWLFELVFRKSGGSVCERFDLRYLAGMCRATRARAARFF